MRSKSKVSRRRNNRRKNASQNYGTLEARNLLATLVSLNAGTGGLEVSLTSNGDVAAIGVTEDGNVTVNGSEDLDIDTSGTQAFATSNLKTINVTGQASQSGQEVSFHDNIQVSSVSVSAIEQLTFEGTLSTTDNFIASLSGEGGQITDSTTGRLVVGHAAYFDAGSNQIRLDNSDNDFNLLRLRTEGYRQNAYITDVNDVVLIGVETSGKFIINAGGEIADAPNTRIHVTRDAYLTAESVTLGDHTSDDTNFFRTGFKVRGHVDLQEDSNIVLRSSNVGSMTLRSVGGILDGKQTRIDVAGKAQLFGNNRIRLGEGSGNTFDSGTVEFQTFGNAKITENSTLKLIGDNSAKTSVIEADGDITNKAFTTVAVAYTADFKGDNIVLGTRLDDQFNVGTFMFETNEDAVGLVKIAEDSSTNLGGTSSANTLRIQSAGNIFDAPTAKISVTYNSRLTSDDGGRIVVGEAGVLADGTEFDSEFESRTLTVQSDGNVIVEDEGDIILTGQNSANSLTLQTRGAEGKILDLPETQIDVRYNLSVAGSRINLGTAIIPNGTSTDSLEFTTLTVNSSGNVNLSADDSIILAGSSTVGGFLTLESEGDIRSTSGSELLTGEGVTFEGMDILVGNLADDCFDIINSNEDGSKRLFVNGLGVEDVQLGCLADGSQGDS